jgi:hypothetical protein
VALMGTAPSVGGATPLAQRIDLQGLEKGLKPALGNSAGAKTLPVEAGQRLVPGAEARTLATSECQG